VNDLTEEPGWVVRSRGVGLGIALLTSAGLTVFGLSWWLALPLAGVVGTLLGLAFRGMFDPDWPMHRTDRELDGRPPLDGMDLADLRYAVRGVRDRDEYVRSDVR
jgi:hypothetical protein